MPGKCLGSMPGVRSILLHNRYSAVPYLDFNLYSRMATPCFAYRLTAFAAGQFQHSVDLFSGYVFGASWHANKGTCHCNPTPPYRHTVSSHPLTLKRPSGSSPAV
jgi:hypothetical protein